jgi:hypothetical protein
MQCHPFSNPKIGDMIRSMEGFTFASELDLICTIIISNLMLVEMLSLYRTDPEVYDDIKRKHLKRFHSKVVTKIELN